MKQPKLKLTPSTKEDEDKERSKVIQKIIDWQFKDADWEFRRKIIKLQEYENKVNPLGLWKVEWKDK